MQIFALIFCLISLSFASTSLILVGGGKRPAETMKEFVSLSGNTQARILIIPWASESTEGAENIKRELEIFNPAKIEIAPHRLNSNEITLFHQNLKNYSGIFFTGGNQNILMSLLREYQLVGKFREIFKQGIVFAGTSAGTAIMSNPMLTGVSDLSVINGNKTELTEGLGLLPANYIVDQHFIVRSRFNRLAGLILEKENIIGLAIDENTSVVIIDSKAKVIGPTQVMLFEKSAENQLKITVKVPGEEFELK